MKAKLGNTTVEFWQISTEKPENEPWVLEAFDKSQLSWSGQLVMDFDERVKLRKQGMGKKSPAEHGNVAEEVKSLDWVGLYISPDKMGSAHPYNIYLVVNQVRIPAFGQIGEYLVKAPDGALEIYSEKKFQRDLKMI